MRTIRTGYKHILVVTVALLTAAFIGAIACGGEADPTPAPVVQQVDPQMIADAVKAVVEASAAESASPEEIQAMVEQAVMAAAAGDSGVSAEEVQSIVSKAVESAAASGGEVDPQLISDAVKAVVEASAADSASPEEIQAMVEKAVMAAAGDSASPEEIQAMMEKAVMAAAGDSASPEEILAMVEKAVMASAGDSASPEEIQAMIEKAVMASAGDSASPEEIQAIVMKAVEAAVAEQGPAMTTEPPGGKVLRISTGSAPPNFNPLIAVSRTQGWVFNHIFSSLTMADPIGLKMTPDLAERWESASDGSSMTFHLRGNALWHDGTPLTSEDVAWTYHMYLNGETGSKRTGVLALIAGGEEYTKGEADSVTGIVAVDDRTIRFEQAFPNILFLAQTTYPILPKHLLGDTLPIDLAQNKFFFDEPLGSGPFKFVSYIPDQRIELEANDDYYFGRPKIDREIISVIKSPDAVQIALQRGEIHLPIFDGGENASTEQFQAFIQDPRFTVSASKGTTLISYAFNSRRDDLVNDKMRQAFLHALDRQRLVDTFAQGNGSIFNSFLVHGWYQLPDWSDKYPYDPDKARQLIAESGWDTNREIGCTIIAVSSEEARAMLAAEQQMLAEVGIKIKFHEVELALWVETFYETYEWDTIRVTFGVFPDPDGFLSFHMRSGSRNAMGYANPTLDEKIDRGKRSIDQAERASIYQEINEEMITTLPLAPVHLLNQWWILDKKFSIPFFDALPEATSFATVPIGPAFLGHSDWQKFHIEQWDLK